MYLDSSPGDISNVVANRIAYGSTGSCDWEGIEIAHRVVGSNVWSFITISQATTRQCRSPFGLRMPVRPSWQTAKEAATPLKTWNDTASLDSRFRLPIRLLFNLLDARFVVASLALEIVHRMRLDLRRCGTPPGHVAHSLPKNTFG
jgi:hypothetical protein